MKSNIIRVLVLIIFFSFLSYILISSNENNVSLRAGVESCHQNISLYEACLTKLSKTILEKKGFDKVYLEMKSINAQNGMYGKCHSFAHELGYNSLDTLNRGEIKSKNLSQCGYGVEHGLLQKAAESYSIDAITKITSLLCTHTSDELFVACIHGVGHAVKVDQLGLYCNSSISNISAKETTLGKEKALLACFQGYAMEDATDKGILYNSLDIKDVSKLCKNYQGKILADCLISFGRDFIGVSDSIFSLEFTGKFQAYRNFCNSQGVIFSDSEKISCLEEVGAAAISLFPQDNNITNNKKKSIILSLACGKLLDKNCLLGAAKSYYEIYFAAAKINWDKVCAYFPADVNHSCTVALENAIKVNANKL